MWTRPVGDERGESSIDVEGLQLPGRWLRPTVAFRISPTVWRNSAGSKGFRMKPTDPARLSLFASSAVPEVSVTTGIPRVVASAFSRSTTVQAVHLQHIVVEENQVRAD